MSESEISIVHRTAYDSRRHLDKMSRLVKQYARYIIGLSELYLVFMLVVLSLADRPITHFTSIFVPPKGYPTLQFDMHTAEDVGLHKFDILSQRGLGKIKDAIALVQENRTGISVLIRFHDVVSLKQDPKINHLIETADAIGCFYVESPAMRMLLKKLKVNDYLGLVAASSIIRPGVAQSGMMRAYIERYRCPEKRHDVLPIMLDIMPDTFGIMVYQEDVFKGGAYFWWARFGRGGYIKTWNGW